MTVNQEKEKETLRLIRQTLIPKNGKSMIQQAREDAILNVAIRSVTASRKYIK